MSQPTRISYVIMAVLLVIAFFANLAVKPVADRYHEHTSPIGGPADRRVTA